MIYAINAVLSIEYGLQIKTSKDEYPGWMGIVIRRLQPGKCASPTRILEAFNKFSLPSHLRVGARATLLKAAPRLFEGARSQKFRAVKG